MSKYNVSGMRGGGGGAAEDDINDIMVELDAAIGAADTAINEVISGGDGRAAKDAIKKVSIKMRDFDTEAIAVIEDKSAAATRTFTPSAEGVPAGTVEQLKQSYRRRANGLEKRLHEARKTDLKRGASSGPFDVDKASATEIADKAMQIQGQDLAGVRRMQRMVGNTEEVAAATMTEMQRQTEQLGRIHQDLEEIDDTLKLAKKQIGMYMRRAATDKLIMAFAFMIFAGIVTIVILHAAGALGDDQVNVPDVMPDINV